MGALAPLTPWIPDDDLLLKNAIEAGASLESLAKGAVQFSRRFTIRELQDRWHSLLYDPTISAEASTRMIEFERSASILPSKSNRADNSKENKNVQEKRKAESVRRCYYAMRKRICTEPLPGDLGFLVQPGDFIGEGEAPGSNNMLGHPMENHFGLEDANFGNLHHVFPQVMRNSDPTCTVDEFPIGKQNMLEDPIEQSNAHKEAPHMLVNNMAMADNCTGVGQMGPSKESAGHGIFEANDMEAHPVCNTKDIMCSGFGGNTIFSSPISDCGTSFHHLQYTSPPPAMPDWKPMESISVPEMPEDVGIRGNNVQTGDPFGIPDEGGAGKGASEFDVMPTETKFNNHMSCDDLKNSTGCSEGFFDELSDTLFNFTPSDEEILNINGEKDVIDKSFYDGLSLLLNSPDDVVADNMDMPEKPQSVAPGAYPDIPSSTGPEEKNNGGDPHLGDIDLQCNSETQVPTSASTVNPQFPEYRDGVICCTLNTEDPEIPCNDDIVFPSKPRPASAHRRAQNDANNPGLTGKGNAGNQASEKGHSTMKREPKRFGESHLASQTQGPQVGVDHTVDECGVKFETSKGELLNGTRNLSTSCGGPSQIVLAIKKESSEPLPVGKPGGIADNPGHVSDLGHAGVGGVNQEGQAPSVVRNQEFYALGAADPMSTEPGGESLLSDPEEQFSESDTDVPYFSDIESMILEMDLGPDDQDSFCSREVAKYQREDAKRAIIRLEQNAHSYMQRTIASHGAFAILYGRHSKHYIKKAEVLLGRGTDDIAVDIDLGREGRANKISRRQAIIKMEKDGTFYLKNLGRCIIYVNNKEIHHAQCYGLHSNCLIEIRGMPFIFETNQARVKQYVNNVARKLEAKALNV